MRRSRSRDAVQAHARCGGSWHLVALTWSGRIVLVDHASLTAERVAIALGGAPAGCMRVLAWWRMLLRLDDWSTVHDQVMFLPEALRRPCLLAWGVHRQRRDRRRLAGRFAERPK